MALFYQRNTLPSVTSSHKCKEKRWVKKQFACKEDLCYRKCRKKGLRDAAFAVMKGQQPQERFRKKFPELPVMPVQ